MSKANIMIQTNLIIPQLVASHPELNWNQKAVLTLIIQHQQNDNINKFSLKDKDIAKILGIKVGNVSTIVGQLFDMGIIDKSTVNTQTQKGVKPKNVRFICLVSLGTWLNGNTSPPIIKRTKEELTLRTKKQFKDLKSDDVEIDTLEPIDTITSAVDDISEIDYFNDVVNVKTKVENDEMITINYEEINNQSKILDAVRDEIKKGKVVKFFEVKVDFLDDEEPIIDTVCIVNDRKHPKLKYATKYMIEKNINY